MSGFWCLTFLISMVPYWITVGSAEMYNKINKNINTDTVRRKLLSEQEGVILVWKK
ncbi:MAG: hypothetical protein ACMUEL_00820 [Flavobacteriales bacterium Tduv]